MKLILDHRERDLYKAIISLIETDTTFKDIKIEIENLELGDIIIRDVEGVDLLIYERKTISDLASSIKDGRYSEQSYRLNALENHNHNIIYLIEGSVSKSYREKQMIYSAMFSVNYYKGFSTIRSYNLDESAYIICNAILKIRKEKDKKPFYNKKVFTEECVDSYSSVIKKKKNANITVDNFGEIVLCQIPSISDKTALLIMNEFKTIKNLIKKLEDDKTCLNNIKSQTRKISKTSIKNIIEFLT